MDLDIDKLDPGFGSKSFSSDFVVCKFFRSLRKQMDNSLALLVESLVLHKNLKS